MRWFTFLFLLNGFVSCLAQDTTNMVKYYDGTRSFHVITKTDTLQIYTYPSGKKESVCPLKKWEYSGTYKRWYDNGKLMWVKELKNGLADGKTILYNTKGIKIAEFIYVKGVITDTVFLLDNIHLILGKLTFTSKVYGGAVRDDGTSNISEHSGPMQNYCMYAAKVDSIAKPVLIQNFKSDWNGDFFVLAPKGKIGFFPKSTPIEKIQPGQFYPPPSVNMSGNDNWDMKGPAIVNNETIISVNLHFSSVGYAP